MREDDPRFRGRGTPGVDPDFIPRIIRFIGLGIGSLLLAVGCILLIRVFSGLFLAVTDPTSLKPAIDQWNEVIDGSQLVLTMDKEKLAFGKVIAVLIMGFAAVIMTHISLAMVAGGTRIVMVCLDDESYVRKILKQMMDAAKTKAAASSPRPPENQS